MAPERELFLCPENDRYYALKTELTLAQTVGGVPRSHTDGQPVVTLPPLLTTNLTADYSKHS